MIFFCVVRCRMLVAVHAYWYTHAVESEVGTHRYLQKQAPLSICCFLLRRFVGELAVTRLCFQSMPFKLSSSHPASL